MANRLFDAVFNIPQYPDANVAFRYGLCICMDRRGTYNGNIDSTYHVWDIGVFPKWKRNSLNSGKSDESVKHELESV